jgi:hypothetical protein
MSIHEIYNVKCRDDLFYFYYEDLVRFCHNVGLRHNSNKQDIINIVWNFLQINNKDLNLFKVPDIVPLTVRDVITKLYNLVSLNPKYLNYKINRVDFGGLNETNEIYIEDDKVIIS